MRTAGRSTCPSSIAEPAFAPADRGPENTRFRAAGAPPRKTAMSILRMTDLDLAGKRVLIREDLNVPVADGRVTSEQRITAALPTLKRALEQGAAVMVMS